MFNRFSEYIKVKKENKEEMIIELENLIKNLQYMEKEFIDIFNKKEYVDIRIINDYKNKYKKIYDKATNFYFDGMEKKKKLPKKYDEELKKIIYIYTNIDSRRAMHNKNITKNNSPEGIDAYRKIGIENPTKEQVDFVLSQERNLLLSGSFSTGKRTAIKAKIQYLIDNGLSENKDFILLDGNDTVEVAKFAKKMLKDTTFNTNLSILDDKEFIDSIREYINNNIHDSIYQNRLIDYYFNYYSRGKVIFEFDTRKDYENYLYHYSPITLNNEKVKSYEAKAIADFLYKSGIKYTYNQDFDFECTLNGSRNRYKPEFKLVDYNLCINIYEYNNDNKAFCDIDEFSNELGEERIYNATENLKNKIEEVREIHKEAEIPLIECYIKDYQNNDLLTNLQKELSSYGVNFKDIDNKELINVIIEIENDFIDILVETLYRNIRAILASGENENSIVNLSRIKNKTTSLLYKRRERIMSLIFPYLEYYLDKFPMDEYRFLFSAKEYIMDKKIDISLQYIFVINAENLNCATFEFINVLYKCSKSKIVFSGSDWLNRGGINGSNTVYYNDFGRFFPGFSEIKFNSVFNVPKSSYKKIREFALNRTGNFEYKSIFINNDDDIIGKIDIHFDDYNNIKENVEKIIASLNEEKTVLFACIYDKEICQFNKILEELKCNNKIVCDKADNIKDKFDVVVWTNTKYSSFGFPDYNISMNDISGIVLSRPDSRTFVYERNMLCKSFSLAKDKFYILYDDKNISNYASEMI